MARNRRPVPKEQKRDELLAAAAQLLVLDGFDVEKIRGKKVAIVDDVVSSGGTLHSLRQIIEEVGGEVAAVVAVFTEGQERPEVTALGHLPLYT